MEILRYAAFTDTPGGGNPAGLVLDARGLDARRMLAIAAEVGYSETAFVFPDADDPDDRRRMRIRYFSPAAEVPFCGHATIATGVALGERIGPGRLELSTAAGAVEVTVARGQGSAPTATLVSVPTRLGDEVAGHELDEVLDLLRWDAAELDPSLPPQVAYAGADHLVLAAATRARLAVLDYDFEGMRALMERRGLTTLDLVWRESDEVVWARNPFPVGGVVEDPATGAAAAAFGGYLRDLGILTAPATFTVLQGHDMGRPSRITVDLLDADRRVAVSGQAVPIL